MRVKYVIYLCLQSAKILMMLPKCKIIMVLSYYKIFQYCNNTIELFTSFILVLYIDSWLLFGIALHIVIAHTNSAIAIFITLSCSEGNSEKQRNTK